MNEAKLVPPFQKKKFQFVHHHELCVYMLSYFPQKPLMQIKTVSNLWPGLVKYD
jgi:hypothetical protein